MVDLMIEKLLYVLYKITFQVIIGHFVAIYYFCVKYLERNVSITVNFTVTKCQYANMTGFLDRIDSNEQLTE